MRAILLFVGALVINGCGACVVEQICGNTTACQAIIDALPSCPQTWKDAACSAKELIGLPVFTSGVATATIATDGTASIHAEFTHLSDLKEFFETFAQATPAVQTAVAASCSTPTQLDLSVTLNGQAYSFVEAATSIAGATTDDTADEFWLNESVQVKSAVLAAATATASLVWNPFDPVDKGQLIRLDAELRASLLPPPDGLQLCKQECEYLHRMLGPNGTVNLTGGIDTDQDADFDDDDDLVGADVADWTNSSYDGDVIKFVLKGHINNAIIPLNDAGAQLEDLGIVFRLQIPKNNARRHQRQYSSALALPPPPERSRRQQTVCPIDLMILVDTSSSIKTGCPLRRDSLRCWNKIKDFLVDLSEKLRIGPGPDDARMGINRFASCGLDPVGMVTRCGTAFGLQTYDTNAGVENGIRNVLDDAAKPNGGWKGGATHTKQGLQVLVDTLVQESIAMAASNVNRANPRRLVMILTDGGYTGATRNPRHNPINVSKSIKEDYGIDVMAVGIGRLNSRRLEELASDPTLIRPLPCTGSDCDDRVGVDFDRLADEVAGIADEFCISEPPTSAPVTTITPVVTTPPPPPAQCGVDLAFVVDVSGSINDLCNQVCGGAGPCDDCWPNCPGHEQCWHDMKTFIAESTRQFEIGTGANETQVALISFSTNASTQFDFNDHQSNPAVATAVDQVVYERCLCRQNELTPGGWCQPGCEPRTHTSLALQKARELFASPTSGARSSSTTKKVVVVITDGESNPGYSPIPGGAALADDGVTVIGVGVNLKAAGRTELSGLAGSNDRVLTVEDFNDLPDIIAELRDLICTESTSSDNGSSPPPPSGGSSPPPPSGGSSGNGNPPGAGSTQCAPDDGYIWSLAITATLSFPNNSALVVAPDQLTINNDGSGVLLPGSPNQTSINALQLATVSNLALRLRGEIGFRVKGKDLSCLRKATGRFYFGLAEDESLMNVFGNPYIHMYEMNVEIKWNFGQFPYMRELLAQGHLYIGNYGPAAKCILEVGDCVSVVAVGAEFTFSRDIRRETNHFGIFAYLRPQGTNALVDLYDAISDQPLSIDRRRWLALLSAMDYGLEVDLVTGTRIELEIELVGELTAAKLPPESQGNLVDGDCNIACQLLHDALGTDGSALLTVSVDWNEDDGLTLGILAELRDTSIVLASSGGSPSVTLDGLSLGVEVNPSNQEFKMAIGASVDLADGPDLEGEIGFSVSQSRRIRRDGTIAAYFNLRLKEPYYNAFNSESTHIVDFELQLEVAGGNGQGISLPNLQATGELCIGDADVCQLCEEEDSADRILNPDCQVPVFASITIGIRLPGQSNIDDPNALTAAPVCSASPGGGQGWEFFIEASIQASNGQGALSRIQNALAGNDASSDTNERMNTFAAATFVLRLTLGPSRVKLSVEAQLHKLDLPPDDSTATSSTCDMICQMCHKLLDNADPGSFIFVRGEFGATIRPFSLSVAVGAGFDGRIEYPDKGLTLTRTGVTLIFEMDSTAIAFEIKLYGSFIKNQTETFGATDGIIYQGQTNNSVVLFRDPYTNQNYGQTTKWTMDGFTRPLQLDGAFALRIQQGRKGTCNSPSTPGALSLIGRIEFAMTGWKMKFLGRRCHIGNVDFSLALTSTPPYFSSFAGSAEICLGTTGRCAKCVLGSSVADCDRTIYLASYVGIGDGNNFVRLELFSTVSLRGFLETFDLDRRVSLPNGLNIIEFGPRPGQRAAIFSLSHRRQVIDKGYDVVTQTYTGNTLTIPMGLVIDGRVTLFPDVSWLRWSADLVLILGSERLLIDYTQTPISWGCDRTGSGCIFELTGYDHTPSTPQGPRFYINVVFSVRRDDVPDMSTADMFGNTGNGEPLDGGCRRRRREATGPNDNEVVSRKGRSMSLGCTTRYFPLRANATFRNIPTGRYRQCLEPRFDGVFDSVTDYSYLEFDVNTLRVPANQEHKFKRQINGSYHGIGDEHLFGSLRSCRPWDSLDGVSSGIIDLRGSYFAIGNTAANCECRGNTRLNGMCTCGQWQASGTNVIMEVRCSSNFQLCTIRCGGSSGHCYLRSGYLQLRYLNSDEQQRFAQAENLVRHGHYTNALFPSDTAQCRPSATCCEDLCISSGFAEFWPTHAAPWNCCGLGLLCCSPGGFAGQDCRRPYFMYAVDDLARAGVCDPRPYCTLNRTVYSRSPTQVPTTETPTLALPTNAPSKVPTTHSPSNTPTTALPSSVPTSAPSNSPTQAPVRGIGYTPQGVPCYCDCSVCDPPPTYTPLPRPSVNEIPRPIRTIRTSNLAECQRACGTDRLCRTMSFDSRTPSNPALASLMPNTNCNIYSTSPRRRHIRQTGNSTDELLFFERDESVSAPNQYARLSDHDNQHHNGETLTWLSATELECKQACDETVECTGMSLYVGVNDSLNCRLLADDVPYGPWIEAENGPWRTNSYTPLCHQDPLLEPTSYRWNESVTIMSFAKLLGSTSIDNDYSNTSRGDDEVFTGDTLYWTNDSTAESCSETCSQEVGCTGILFYPVGLGLDGKQCRLAATSMESDDSWTSLTDGRRRQIRRRLRIQSMIRRRPLRPSVAVRSCVCRGWVITRPPVSIYTRPPTRPVFTRPPIGDVYTRPPTRPVFTRPPVDPVYTGPPTPPQTTTAIATTPTPSPTASPTASPSCTAAIEEELSCVGDPSQTCILIHARTKILGLVMRVKIQMAKNAQNKWLASLDADGSLFGSFLRAHFQVRVALSRPRSFRALGSMVAQSKEEVLNRVKASLQATADDASARFEAKRQALEDKRAVWDAKIAQKQAIVDSKRAIFEAKAASLRAKADALAAKRAQLQQAQQNLDNVCTIRCCTRSCAGNLAKRIACRAQNTVCRIRRAAKAVLLAIAQAALAVAQAALNAAAAIVDASQIVLDAAILVLEGVRIAGQAAISVAQAALTAIEALVRFGLYLAQKILEGAFALFYFNEFSFDFQLSRDSKYFEYHLDCTLFGKRIIIDSHLDFSSVGSAIRSLIRAIVDIVKALFRNNRIRRSVGTDDRFLLPMAGASGTRLTSHHDSRVRYNAESESAPVFENVCEGTCVCHSCVKSVKQFFASVLNQMMKTKNITDGVKWAAVVADSMNTADRRDALVADALAEFKAEALERRAAAQNQFGSVENECAGEANVTACILILNTWEAELDAMNPSDPAEVNIVVQEMSEEFEADDFAAQQYHELADEAEQLSWRDTVSMSLLDETKGGIGCVEIECVDVGDCMEQTSHYLLENLDALADDSVCPDGYTSDDGGCDSSAELIQQQAAQVADKWRALVPALSSLFLIGRGTPATLADAIETLYKARNVLGEISPAEACEGRLVVPDTSETLDNETIIHALGGANHRAFVPAAPTRNVVLYQLPTYSSICAGSGLSLTDGSMESSITPFSTCNESSPFVEVPTAPGTIVSMVRVSKQCSNNQQSDPTVLGLQIQVKTHAGVFTCGDDVAAIEDAACDGLDYWERACDIRIPSISVIIKRPGMGSIITTEIEAEGEPSAVSNVLLGQSVSSTSQCHERPTFNELGRNNDMYPTTPGAQEILVSDKRECLDLCESDQGCVAVSYFDEPLITPNGSNCILSPNALLDDDIVYNNVPEAQGENSPKIHHFSKHVPFQRLESLANQIHGGPLLAQACVRDLADCKTKCAEDLRCTGFTFFGDEDDLDLMSVCTMTGTPAGSVALSVFTDGPFARIPSGGISSNLGRAPGPGEVSEYNVSENYAIVLGVDKVTDGFYQPTSASLNYVRQGFLHTCGETDSDGVVVPTMERSSVHAVRVWKRCDCCEHRAVGLQVMQQVEIPSGDDTDLVVEWRRCGTPSTEQDAECDDEVGPEMQYWERQCNHSVATIAIKIIRVSTGLIGPTEDLDFRSIDLPEIEAFGTFFAPSTPISAGRELEIDLDSVVEDFYTATAPVETVNTNRCDEDLVGQTEPSVVIVEPLMVCAVGDDIDNDDTLPPKDETVTGDEGVDSAIIGAIAGGAVLLILVAILIFLALRKRGEDTDKEAWAAESKLPKQTMMNPMYEDTADFADDPISDGIDDGYLTVETNKTVNLASDNASAVHAINKPADSFDNENLVEENEAVVTDISLDGEQFGFDDGSPAVGTDVDMKNIESTGDVVGMSDSTVNTPSADAEEAEDLGFALQSDVQEGSVAIDGASDPVPDESIASQQLDLQDTHGLNQPEPLNSML